MSTLSRLERLFQAAADLPAGERSGFLDRECVGEAELRARVEAMLFDLDGGETLDRPPAASGAAGLVGETIGRYRLLEAIGEGGFGVVYRAEQTAPLRREVALKIVKVGMDTKEVVARFEAERQALAMMDHPSIAKVLDGGTTDRGRPYFVLELVRGLPIDEYCDRERLTVRQRLELFIEVCQAVQHAHQKGVIHRDLKPSNILVALRDGRAVPKVIDFGVAKALHGRRLTEKTLYTAFHGFLGTPAYMSPEQAAMSALDVDTRSDVYSLGVLLYELLAGAPPFDGDRLAQQGLGEIQRVLREDQPSAPSTHLSSVDDPEAVARCRRLSARELCRQLRGELDWIALKAIEKERARRYATASELGVDVRRYLDDEPVVAGPPSHLYRLRKLLARHRAAAAWAALVLLALAGGIVGTTIGMVEAARQRDLSRREAARAVVVTDFLVDTLALTDPEVALDPAPSVGDLLDRASAKIEGAFATEPQAEARVRATLGRAYESLTRLPVAERHLRRAVELADTHGGLSRRELYDTLWVLTHALFKLERPDAQEIAHRARRHAHELIRDHYPELAADLDRFIAAIRSDAHGPEREPIERAMGLLDAAIARADVELPPGDPLWPVVADSCMDASFSLWYTPHEALAERSLAHALEIRRRELPERDADTAEAMSLLAGVLARNGRPGDAEERLRATLEELSRTFTHDSLQVAFAQGMLGENLVAQGRFAEAEPLLLASHETILSKVENAATFYPIDSFSRILRLYDGWGRPESARPFRLAFAEAVGASQWPVTWPFLQLALEPQQRTLIEALAGLEERLGGRAYSAEEGSLDGGELAGRVAHALDLFAATLPPEDPRHVAVARLFPGWARALASGETRDMLSEAAYQSLSPFRERIPLDVAEAAAALACDGAREGADGLLDEATRLLRDLAAADSWFSANAKAQIGRCFLRRRRFDEAGALLREAHATLEIQLGPSNRDYRAVGRLLAELAEVTAAG